MQLLETPPGEHLTSVEVPWNLARLGLLSFCDRSMPYHSTGASGTWLFFSDSGCFKPSLSSLQ